MTFSQKISLQEYETRAFTLPARSRTILENLSPFLCVSKPYTNGQCDFTASHWVGSVLVPDGYVSVAPKVGGANALRMMLEGEGELPEAWKECLARIESKDLWDALALALGRELTHIRAAGYQGAYVEEEDNRQCVRGKVLPIQDLRSNTPVRRGTYSRDAVWSFDIPINQALTWASSTLVTLARSDATHSILAESRLLSGIKEVPPAADWLPEVGDRYRRAVFLAQLVRRAWAPQVSTLGYMSQNAIVNMNDVFEKFVRSRLRRSLAQKGLSVLEKGTYRRRFSEHAQVEPDLVMADKTGRVVAIGDVKYKWRWNFNNSDIFQMNAYLETYPEASTAFVFFPSNGEGGPPRPERMPRNRTLIPVALDPNSIFDESSWNAIAGEVTRQAQMKAAI